MISAVIFGHSFISRLNKFIAENNDPRINSSFNLQYVSTNIYGRGGLCVHDAQEHLQIVAETNPEIVYLELGCNDLARKEISPYDLVENMLQLSSILYTSYNVRQIIFGQVLKRDNLPKHLSDFNDKVATFNIVFHARCSDDRLPFHQYVTFWKHRGFWNSCTPVLSDDGLHLSDAGLIKHYFSVSRALVFVHNKVLTTGGGYSSLGPPQ